MMHVETIDGIKFSFPTVLHKREHRIAFQAGHVLVNRHGNAKTVFETSEYQEVMQTLCKAAFVDHDGVRAPLSDDDTAERVFGPKLGRAFTLSVKMLARCRT